jgi:alpha,alpha-trehalase
MTRDIAAGHALHVLREYAFLADGIRGAIVGPRGDISWLCMPRWDSPAVISQLIGGPGIYAITPTQPFVWGGSYEPGSLIWSHRWITQDGSIITSREALAHPGDPHRMVLLRQVSADKTERVQVELQLAGDFGQAAMTALRRDETGAWTGRLGPLNVRWAGAPDGRWDGDTFHGELELHPGRQYDFILEISDRTLPEPVDPGQLWHTTEHRWQEDQPDLLAAAAPRDARHAYTLLRGLTAPNGGMVAAATLGLPERAEQGRNYDYRYVWIRDQIYAGLAGSVDQPLALLDDALAFVTARLLEDGDDLAPAYRSDGGPVPNESELDLPGYPGGIAKVGNRANNQFQLDAIGEILQLLAAGARLDRLGHDQHQAIDVAVSVIERRWELPDAGIWELDDAWWTHSRLAVVGGLRAIGQQAPATQAARLSDLADTIMAETTRRALSPEGYWQRSPDHPGVDASLLLPPVRGALPADDPRTRATLRQVERDLVVDGHVYRFRPDERPLGEAEGSFTLCGFLLSLAHLHQGDPLQAYRYFDIQRTVCGPPGILAEEFDVAQRQLRGNFPQAFVHALLLETGQRLPANLPPQ